MRYAHLFVLPAALICASSALAGGSWEVVKDATQAVVYEEVSDNVYMPKGLLETLPNSDQLLDLIEETAVSQKAGFFALRLDSETDKMTLMYCEVFTDTWTDADGNEHTVTLEVCST